MLYKHAFNGNGALEHTTAQMKPWKYYAKEPNMQGHKLYGFIRWNFWNVQAK